MTKGFHMFRWSYASEMAVQEVVLCRLVAVMVQLDSEDESRIVG